MVAETMFTASIGQTPSASSQPDRQALHGIQILRGLAAFAVVVHHVLEELYGAGMPDFVTRVGAAGVDVFFVISGFIMLHTSAHRFGAPAAAPDFMTRRVIRIVPLYWLFTGFVLACHLLGVAYVNQPITPASGLSSLLFLPTTNIALNVGWTLNFEMYFYALFAACLAVGRSPRAILAVPVMIVAVIALGHLLPSGPWRTFLTDRIALEFVFGMGLAALYRSRYAPARFVGVAMVVGVCAMVLASALAPAEGTGKLAASWRFLVWGAPATLVVYSMLGVGEVRSRIGRAWLAVGDASYSLYLSHAVVMALFGRMLKNPAIDALPTVVLFFGALGAAVLVGQLTYMWIERPITESLKAVWERRRSRRLASA